MRSTVIVVAILTTSLALCPGSASAQSRPPARDIGAEARAVFADKCAACHGPDLAKPEGRFGYVLDLPRVAKNPEIVIPRQPGESELWMLVEQGEMPPPDSPRGPLTGEQKQTIHEWIASGAPDALADSGVARTAVQIPSSTCAFPPGAPTARVHPPCTGPRRGRHRQRSGCRQVQVLPDVVARR